MTEQLEFLPNAFYDLIVFGSSTVLFALGVSVGFGWWNWARITQVRTLDAVLVTGAVIFFGYEYGRVAEAWSALLVQGPLRYIGRHTRWFASPDFCNDLREAESALGLEQEVPGSRNGGKWTVYFYANVIDPRIGADLLKRYAWEKASRNSAFTTCLLFMISLLCPLLRRAGVWFPFRGSWTFGSWEFTVMVAIGVLFTYVEYYKRNCWNQDLIRKVLPVLKRAESLHYHEPKEVRLLPNSRVEVSIKGVRSGG